MVEALSAHEQVSMMLKVTSISTVNLSEGNQGSIPNSS
jgi:hypothetical protein